MSRGPHFNLGFTNMSDAKLDEKVNLIASNMSSNANYPTPGSRISDMVTAQSDYNIIKGKKGTVLNYKQIKKQGRQDLIDAMVTLGVWARDKYPGDVTKWKTTGYTIQEYDTVTHVPNTPENVKVKDAPDYDNVMISYDKVEFAISFEGRHWLKGSAQPSGITNSSQTLKMLFTNLAQGKPYNFQVRAVGTAGRSEWSPAITFVPRADPSI